ncbi:MAG: ATP-binding protein [Myxococcales bacterium]|nr:ATP-binding protein [Myxococcales bacterium]
MYRKRFGLTGHPLPKNAQGKTFYEDSPAYRRLGTAFRQLVDEPGVGLITSEPGVGKTAALRNLCATLPKPDHLVLYLCDTAVSAARPVPHAGARARCRAVAPARPALDRHQEGARAHGRRAAHQPVLVLDEAQHLSDGGFCSTCPASSTSPSTAASCSRCGWWGCPPSGARSRSNNTLRSPCASRPTCTSSLAPTVTALPPASTVASRPSGHDRSS